MRKSIFISCCIWVLSALPAVAQPRFVSDTEAVDFGQIAWKHPVTAHYTITNTGNEPLVLTDVEPDCACAVASWTKAPIAPGEKGTVSVEFDAQMLGHFEKAVTILTNAEPHLVRLKLTGEVVRRVTDFSRSHPFVIGKIRLDRDELRFPDTYLGGLPQLNIGVANQSGQPYRPVLMHLPSYLEMKVEPDVLQDGEQGTITLTLHTDKLPDYGLTRSSVYLSRFEGDKVGDENELPVSVVLLPDLSEVAGAGAPSIGLSAQRIDLSAALAQKTKAHQDVVVTNEGRSPLVISKVQVFHPAVGVRLKKNVLKPGEKARMRITVNKKHFGKRHRHLSVLMITNDPAQPKVEIDIIAAHRP